MGESLYAILGVEEDADREAIEDAYRDRAKDAHPDVSDAADATRRFKRLTVARDTLLDEDERARYDELGHDTYVRQHDRTDLFDVRIESSADGGSASVTTDAVSAATTVTNGYGGAEDWWRERAGPDPKPADASDQPRTQSRNGSTAAWARSRSAERSEISETSETSMIGIVREAGIWLVFHVLLLCSAVATAIVLYTSVGPALVAPAILFGLVVVVAAIAASTFHLVSIVYT